MHVGLLLPGMYVPGMRMSISVFLSLLYVRMFIFGAMSISVCLVLLSACFVPIYLCVPKACLGGPVFIFAWVLSFRALCLSRCAYACICVLRLCVRVSRSAHAS